MGTSSNQRSPDTPPWRLARAVVGSLAWNPDRQSAEIWRAAMGDREGRLVEELSTPLAARACELAARLTSLLAERGREVAPRGNTTLVSFSSRDPEQERIQLAEAGVVVRNIPGRPWLRASVGAWNDEDDLDRLLATLAT